MECVDNQQERNKGRIAMSDDIVRDLKVVAVFVVVFLLFCCFAGCAGNTCGAFGRVLCEQSK